MHRTEYDLAERALLQAIAQRHTDWQAHWLLGRLYLKTARPLDAQLELERAHAIRDSRPHRDDIEDDIAEALLMQNDPEALTDFLGEASRSGGDVRDYVREGRYLTRIGDFDNAATAIDNAIADNQPPTAAPYLTQARLYETVGDPDRTVLALRRAYYYDPDNSDLVAWMERYSIVPGPTAGLPPAE